MIGYMKINRRAFTLKSSKRITKILEEIEFKCGIKWLESAKKIRDYSKNRG